MKFVYAAAATLLLAGLSFVLTSRAGSLATLSWSAVVGAVCVLFARLIGDAADIRTEGVPMVIAGSTMTLAWVLRWAWIGLPDREGVWYDAAAVFLSLGVAWSVDLLIARRSDRRCFICKTRIEERRPMACPRCQQVICTQPSCWVARHLRCRYCDERDVVLFPMRDESWWRTRVGSRVTTGTCGSCFDDAATTDLRACGECSWPMCKRCWDYHNGRCVRCQWIMPALPESLRPFLAGTGAAPEAVERRLS